MKQRGFAMTLSRIPLVRLTVLCVLLICVGVPTRVRGQEASAQPANPVQSAAQLRQQIQQLKEDRQLTERELSLKQAAATVSAQRVEELKKQLLAVESRASAEAAEALKLREKSALLEQHLVRVTADLPAHEAADSAVAAADRSSRRSANCSRRAADAAGRAAKICRGVAQPGSGIRAAGCGSGSPASGAGKEGW